MGAVLVLALAVLLPLAGCGSADREAYFKEMREINEELASRIGGLGEELAELRHEGEEGREQELAEILTEMAAILEEGARDLSQVRVPAGIEEAHASLLELLSRTAAGHREAASALNPGLEEWESGGGEEEGGEPREEEDHAAGEDKEEGSPVSAPTGEDGHREGH